MFTGFSDFQAQFARLARRLVARGRKMDEAEEAVQEAYARLLGYLAKGEQVKEPEAFLTEVAYNVAADQRRRHGERLKDARPLENIGLADTDPSPEEAAVGDELFLQTQQLLEKRVGARACEVFFLYSYGGFSYAEIARQVGTTVRTVEYELVKATKALVAHEMMDRLRGTDR